MIRGLSFTDRIKLVTHGFIRPLDIAQCYHYGRIVDKNNAFAYKLYQDIIASGDINAYFYLGCYYEELQQDAAAIKTYITGAYQRDLNSIERLKQLAGKRNIEASYALGCYFDATQNVPEALNHYFHAATLGHTAAMYHLGEFLYSQNNKNEGIFWFYQAAVLNSRYGLNKLVMLAPGEALAAFFMAELYQSDRSVLTKTQEKAIHYYKLACDLGDKNAAYCLAELLKKDSKAEAIDYLLLAALRKHPQALNDLLAFASQDDAKAQFACFTYFRNNEVPNNIQKAITWLLKAVKQNYHEAIHLLNNENWNISCCMMIASLYVEDDVINKDLNQAIKFYKLAADKNNSEAFFFLAQIYQSISSYSQANIDLICEYYLKAAQLGNQIAVVPLESLGKKSSIKTQTAIGRFFEERHNSRKSSEWNQKVEEIKSLRYSHK